ncbi:MAG: SAM-dependent methyltransferase [Magnetococcales bacterium]|nr:SAM-dependent methyltransferase [Magnetococcales bacterium]
MKTELKKIIQAAGGSISYAQYMRHALYHPQKGYYMTVGERLGVEGDFITSPELTSLFGELLTLQMVELWQLMGSPTKFQLIEMGPGSGRLAQDILLTAKRFPKFYSTISYELIEISQDFKDRQEKTLKESGVIAKAKWHKDLNNIADNSIVGVIFANEFLDALPVHWLEQTPDGLSEVGVCVNENGDFTTVLQPLSAEIADDYFTSRNITLTPGSRTEVGIAGQQWIKKAGEVLQQGLVLLIDYGHPQKDYYTPLRENGTLTGHLKHVRIDDPLANPGEMDITAHVDFTAIVEAGRASELELAGYTSQGWFLQSLGILERLEMLRSLEGVDIGNLKEAVLRLILPEGMGETFKVLALGKKISQHKLSGFRLNDQRDKL